MFAAMSANTLVRADDALEEIRGEVYEQPHIYERRGPDQDSPRESDDPFADDDFEDDGSLFCLALGAVAAPIWCPRLLIGDTTLDPGYFLRYPFRRGHPGFVSEYEHEDTRDRYWVARSRLEYASNFDSVYQLGGQVLLDTAIRFGFDTEARRLHEPLPGEDDSLWMGDTNLVYRFAQSERVQMRTGAGMNWFVDQTDDAFGFNFTYSGDFFPCDPWIVSTELDLGWLGESRLVHGRTTLGWHYIARKSSRV
jgi:hypothetical protein